MITIKNKIESASSISILSHINPDADTIATALGIYSLLRQDKSKRVEVANACTLPLYLDFLPYYKKIKSKIEYADSLIISCGRIDSMGFDVEGREIITLEQYDSASASLVAYKLFKEEYEINVDVAECFYTALLSDTRHFTTNMVNLEVFTMAQNLISKGVKPEKVAYHLTQRKSLASLRILERGLASLRLYDAGKIAMLIVDKEDKVATGASVADMECIVDYGMALYTVHISICLMELERGIRISLRSKGADVSLVAMALGAGGHKVASGLMFEGKSIEEAKEMVLNKIKELGIVNGI
jgi:phosphoesterase RecJ-like protein